MVYRAEGNCVGYVRAMKVTGRWLNGLLTVLDGPISCYCDDTTEKCYAGSVNVTIGGCMAQQSSNRYNLNGSLGVLRCVEYCLWYIRKVRDHYIVSRRCATEKTCA